MNRLTERNADGSVKFAKGCYSGCEYITCSMEEGYQCNHQCEADAMCKLAEYEDAEEQGLLLRLPCKVGDTVYTPCAWGIESGVVGSIEMISDRVFVNNEHHAMIGEAHNIYLTKEEAEQALKQMGEKA